MTSACDAEAIDPPVARRTTYTLVLAAAILLPLALATDDSAEHGTPLVVVLALVAIGCCRLLNRRVV